MAEILNTEAIIPDKPKFRVNLSKERDRLIKILEDTLRKQGVSENELSRQQLDRNILLVIARGLDQYFWFCYWIEDKGGYDAFDQDDFEALSKCSKDTSDEEVSHLIKLPYEKNLYSEKVEFEWIIGTNYTQAAVDRFIASRLLERLALLESKDSTQLPVQAQSLQTLLEKYEITSPDKLKQMTELDLLNEFVIPLFQSLGWSVERPATFQKPVGESDLTLLSPNEDIRIPVEVKRFGQSLDSAVEQVTYYAAPDGEWAIATNFEITQVLDTQIRQVVWTLRDPKTYLTSSDLQALTPDAVKSGSLRRKAELTRTSQQSTEDEVPQSQVGTETHTANTVIYTVLSDESQQLQTGQETLNIATRALADVALTDNTDYLGFNDYADAIADFITNDQTKKPITIGIDAAWGMGKTTLMYKIRSRLSGEEEKKSIWQRIITSFQGIVDWVKRKKTPETRLSTVWFNAWKYDEEERLWAALALEVLKAAKEGQGIRRFSFWWQLTMKRFESERALGNALRSLWKLIAPIVVGIVVIICAILWANSGIMSDAFALVRNYWISVGTLGLIAFILTTGKQLLAIWNEPFDMQIGQYINAPTYEAKVGFLSEFEEDFARVVEVISDKGKHPLVIFIDDLDRCAPPKPVEVIEAINILLDSKHCVFVIGMDTRAIIASIETKYGNLGKYFESDQSNVPILGRSFLEKIIQIHFRIPPPSKSMIERFVGENLGYKGSPEDVSLPNEEVKEIERIIEAEQRAGRSLEEARRVAEKIRPEMPPEVIKKAQQEVFARSFDESTEVLQAIKDATPYLGGNPRKIKRFINAFRLQALIANRRGLLEKKVITIACLGRWTVIATRWPEFLADLSQDLSLLHDLTVYGLATNSVLAQMHGFTEAGISTAKSFGSRPFVEKWSKVSGLMNILTADNSFRDIRAADYLHLASVVEVSPQ